MGAEVEEERKQRAELEERNQKSKELMEAWEQTTPPENVIQEVIVEGVDEATKIAKLKDDEREIKVPDEMYEELKGMLQQISELPEEEKEGKMVQAKVEIVEDEVAMQLHLPAVATLVLKSYMTIGGPASA